MCLVSYIPTAHGYILSSNRDEFRDRSAESFENIRIGKEQVLFPKDPKGGSWVMVSDFHRVICLLNGAFENHMRKPPYRHSRGLVMKSFFEYDDAVAFFEHYNLENIEPFTMVIMDRDRLYEYRWDGVIKHVSYLQRNEVHIWSSATLYDHSARQERTKTLLENLKSVENSAYSAIQSAHLFTDPNNVWNGLVMNRGNVVQTISHTQVISERDSIRIKYLNLLNDELVESSI